MITKSDIRYLKIAEEASKLSTYGRISIGAAILYKGVVIGLGCNQRKSHPVQKHYNELLPYHVQNPYLHAEIASILNAKGKVKNATMYVFRRGRNGKLLCCFPCYACMGAILHYGIKRVVFTTEFGIEEKGGG